MQHLSTLFLLFLSGNHTDLLIKMGEKYML